MDITGNKGTLDILVDVLSRELEISPERVFAYNNDIELPEDNDLFVVLYFMQRSPYSNNLRYKGNVDNLQEVQTTNIVEDIMIAVMSRDTSARDRVWEINLALNSTYSQYQQEKYHMHISTINETSDSSFLEATARLNRFDIRCRVFRGYDKIKNIDFYDKYPNTSKFEPEWHLE